MVGRRLMQFSPSGGILILWRPPEHTVHEVVHGIYTLSIHIELADGFSFWCSPVYGPYDDCFHLDFWNELHDVAGLGGENWIIGGDFKMLLAGLGKIS